MDPSTPPPGQLPRLLNVALAIVIGVALVGFLVGTRPPTDRREPELAQPCDPLSALPGQTYEELRAQRFRLPATSPEDWAALARDLPPPGPPVAPTPAERAAAVTARAERRAFNGAPPVVPHPVDEQSSAACLACHERGAAVGEKIASRISHLPYPSCTQCHVPGTRRPTDETTPPENRFVGLPSGGKGPRAWIGAPPTIPHSTFMRPTCASCHGPAGLKGLRTPHPQRASCEQCHAPAADLEPSGVPR
jgi:nitrate reductase (cytochrome), electron transfer subunit